MEVESSDTRDIYNDLEGAEQRWINKETKKKSNVVEDILGSMNTSPSFVTGFKLLSENGLL